MRQLVIRSVLNATMALRTLLDRPVRSMLTLLGIVIGIVALVVMMSLIESLDTSVRTATRPLGVGVFQVQREPRFSSRFISSREASLRKPFTMDDVHELRRKLKLTREVGGEMWSWLNSFRTNQRKAQPACGVA